VRSTAPRPEGHPIATGAQRHRAGGQPSVVSCSPLLAVTGSVTALLIWSIRPMGAGPEATLFNVLRGVVRPLANRNPILSQRRGGMQGLSASRVSPWLRENIGFPSIETRFSHGDTETRRRQEQLFQGVSQRLCASARTSGFCRSKPRFSRRDAETRRNAKPTASLVSPWLRASVRTSGFPQSKPGSLTELRSHGEGRSNFFRGFLSVSAPPREHPVLPDRNHDSLAEALRCGGMRSRPLQWFAGGTGPL
jgi:hypothetical protein